MNDRPASRPRLDWDLAASVVLALIGLAVCVHAWSFPGGSRGVPGPAFFPLAIGGLLIALSLVLAAVTRHAPASHYWTRADHKPVLPKIGAILILLVIYVSIWNVVPFVVRTPFLLVAIYRVLGEPWPRTLSLAALLTTALFVVFEGLLAVQL